VSDVLALSLGGWPAAIFGQQPGERTFTSAGDAGCEFLAAMRSQDQQAPLWILGTAGRDVLSCGDSIEDSDDGEGLFE